MSSNSKLRDKGQKLNPWSAWTARVRPNEPWARNVNARLATAKPAAQVGDYASVKEGPGWSRLCVIEYIAPDKRHFRAKEVSL